MGCGQKLQPGPVNTDNGRSAACLSFDKRLHSRSRRHRGESVCVCRPLSIHSHPPALHRDALRRRLFAAAAARQMSYR